MSKNYILLYKGLKIYRDAMLAFITAHLEAIYGDNWWERGVRRVFPKEEIDRLEQVFQDRFSGLPVVERPGTERYEILDISYFNNIVEGNWKPVFAAPLKNERSVLVWMKEISTLRNAVMHTETGDLKDDDTWRGIDTMDRILRLADSASAPEISNLKREARGIPARDDLKPGVLDLKEGSLDYGHGLALLDRAIAEQVGVDNDTYYDYQGYRRQLIILVGEARITPGMKDSQVEATKSRVLRELDRMASKYLGIPSFTDACISAEPVPGPEDVPHRIRRLELELRSLNSELYEKLWKKLAQDFTGEVIPQLERDIENIQSKIQQRQNALQELIKVASPSAYFSVDRIIGDHGVTSFIEEQRIDITVNVGNLGHKVVNVSYGEAIPKEMEVDSGKTSFSGPILPGKTIILSYTVSATKPGRYQLSTAKLAYPGKKRGWDRVKDSIVEIRAGSSPHLIGTRYYRYTKDGIELIVHLENKGEKTARNVRYEELVEMPGPHAGRIPVSFRGEIRGGESKIVERQLTVDQTEKVRFTPGISIPYQDTQGNAYSIVLAPDWKRIEYNFPRAPTVLSLVGRNREIEKLSEMIEQVWQMLHQPHRPGAKRLLFVEGIEGAGKTRLVYELIRLAHEKGFHCFLEDAKDRNPVKRILRRMLGLEPDEDDDQIIWQKLRERLSSDESNRYSQGVFQYISSLPAQFNETDLKLLRANVLTLIKRLCSSRPSLLVFENIHWTPEGIEQQLLSSLFQDAIVDREKAILICGTYRPGEHGSFTDIDTLGVPRDYYEHLPLLPLAEQAIHRLVDQIVEFPRFSQDLHHFVATWSQGNPLYLIELLRLLTDTERGHLVRVGSEWQPKPRESLASLVPDKLDGVILERVEVQLPHEADFIKSLSAIGFELPIQLIEAFCEREYKELSKRDLYQRLAVLERAGLIVMASGLSQGSEIERYEFEHQRKREVLYGSLPEARRLYLRQTVAEILLSQVVYRSGEEQTRQLARHLVKSPKAFAAKHLNRIRDAAELERNRRDFTRSLELFDAAIQLAPPNSFELIHLLVERSRLHQMRGALVLAGNDLKQAQKLVGLESPLALQDRALAKNDRYVIDKERARLMLTQPQASLDEINDLLYSARIGMEGNLRLRRWFPPKSLDFYRDLVDIYLSLAEVWLRKQNYRTCKAACKRAESLAQRAKRNLGDKSLLPLVYMSLGDLYQRRGQKREDLQEALRLYHRAQEEAANDLYHQERILLAMGDTFRRIEDTPRARDSYEQAMTIQQKLGDTYGLALSLGELGNLCVDSGHFERGRYYLEEAVAYQQETGDTDRFWRTCVSLAEIHLNAAEIETAWQYWTKARVILFEQRIFGQLKSRKQHEVFEILRTFKKYFANRPDEEPYAVCIRDTDFALPLVSWDREELASVQIELGETRMKAGQWREAIEALTQALELGEKAYTRAEAHELLGDIYSSFELPSRALAPNAAWTIEAQDQAEYHYEAAVKLLMQIDSVHISLRVYEKLLNRLLADQSGLLLLPFTFLRILRAVPLQERVHDQFVEKAVEILLRNALFAEAGDIVVYTAREVARANDQSIPYKDKLAYLRRAEVLYRQGNIEDMIWGLNMLIPTWHRLNQWDEILKCFKELFKLNIEIEDVDEFLNDFGAIWMFEDIMDVPEIVSLVEIAEAASEAVQFSDGQRARLFLYMAKSYTEAAHKSQDGETKITYEDMALEYYGKVLRITSADSAMMSTALNDSAVIYHARKQHEEALSRFSESIQIAEQVHGHGTSSVSRHNRALLHLDMGSPQKARMDFELALKHLTTQVEHWNKQLQNEDQHPPSPAQVAQSRYDKHSLASICAAYGRFLASNGEIERGMALTKQSAQLLEEIGLHQEALDRLTSVPMAALKFGAIAATIPFGVQNARPCPTCGAPLADDLTRCSSCSQSLCPQCGAAIQEDASICSSCGTEFDYTCPRCKATLSAQADVCPNCGLGFLNKCPRCGEVVDVDKGRCPVCGQAICPECGSAVEEDDDECPACGVSLVLNCPNCGTEVDPEATVCPLCGERFDSEDS